MDISFETIFCNESLLFSSLKRKTTGSLLALFSSFTIFSTLTCASARSFGFPIFSARGSRKKAALSRPLVHVALFSFALSKSDYYAPKTLSHVPSVRARARLCTCARVSFTRYFFKANCSFIPSSANRQQNGRGTHAHRRAVRYTLRGVSARNFLFCQESVWGLLTSLFVAVPLVVYLGVCGLVST